MDFHKLMSVAVQNKEEKKIVPVKKYSTSVPPPKKIVKPKTMSPNVLAFLEKKAQEEKQKAIDQKKSRQKYINESRKCYRKVQNIHELIAEDNGDEEETVGHSVLQKSRARTAHQPSMQRVPYVSPAKPVVPSTQQKSKSTHSEVPAKKTKTEDTPSSSKMESKKSGTNKTESQKKKKPAKAPTMSFEELMKIAANKDKQQQKSGPAHEAQFGRMMTKKEKEDELKRREYKNSKEYKIWANLGPAALEKYKQQQREKEERESGPTKPQGKPAAAGVKRTSTGSPVPNKKPVPISASPVPNKRPVPSNAAGRSDVAKRTVPGPSKGPTRTVPSAGPSKGPTRTVPSAGPSKGPAGPSRPAPKTVKARNSPKYDATNENVLVCRPARDEEEGMSAWDRIYSKIHQKRAPPPQARRGGMVIESDDEYDEEMDDFIDDEPLDDPYSKGISSHIRDIFGYDKRKYQDDDHDIDNMESSFVQQMKEEKMSARLGLKEDLEDIRKEEEEMKRKMAMKKKMTKKR